MRRTTDKDEPKQEEGKQTKINNVCFADFVHQNSLHRL
jgi:hypothetical protein